MLHIIFLKKLCFGQAIDKWVYEYMVYYFLLIIHTAVDLKVTHISSAQHKLM